MTDIIDATGKALAICEGFISVYIIWLASTDMWMVYRSQDLK